MKKKPMWLIIIALLAFLKFVSDDRKANDRLLMIEAPKPTGMRGLKWI